MIPVILEVSLFPQLYSGCLGGEGGAELSHLEEPSAFGLSLHKQETEAQKATVLYSKQMSAPLGQGQTPSHGP